MQIVCMNGRETREETQTTMLRYAVSRHTATQPARLQQAWRIITTHRDGTMPPRVELDWRDVETVVVDDNR